MISRSNSLFPGPKTSGAPTEGSRKKLFNRRKMSLKLDELANTLTEGPTHAPNTNNNVREQSPDRSPVSPKKSVRLMLNGEDGQVDIVPASPVSLKKRNTIVGSPGGSSSPRSVRTASFKNQKTLIT